MAMEFELSAAHGNARGVKVIAPSEDYPDSQLIRVRAGVLHQSGYTDLNYQEAMAVARALTSAARIVGR